METRQLHGGVLGSGLLSIVYISLFTPFILPSPWARAANPQPRVVYNLSEIRKEMYEVVCIIAHLDHNCKFSQ